MIHVRFSPMYRLWFAGVGPITDDTPLLQLVAGRDADQALHYAWLAWPGNGALVFPARYSL